MALSQDYKYAGMDWYKVPSNLILYLAGRRLYAYSTTALRSS
jgi:hypothetical protein